MKKINLMQMLEIRGLETQFSTTKDISNRELLQFYYDFSKILKQLDSEINYESWTHTFREFFKFPYYKYRRIIKCLQVRNGNPKKFDAKNIVRTHLISYQKNPTEFSDEEKARLEENMFKDFILTRPNINIISTNQNYSSDNLLSRIKDIPYIGISDEYDNKVFNPKDIIDVVEGKKYSNMFLNGDGTLFIRD